MKTKKITSALLASLLSLFVFVSCSTEDAVVLDASQGARQKASAPVAYCGTPASVDLVAGQNAVSGSVSVGNDEENLYVTYSTVGDWSITEVQLYVGTAAGLPVNKGGNPSIGQFPYKVTYTSDVTAYTFSIPLSTLPSCVTIAAHAVVVRRDLAGNILQKETGWARGPRIGGNSWAMKFEYCVQECVVEEPACYQEETAWTAGTRFVNPGNWATYTSYAPGVVNIYAGQNNLAGTATFSSVSVNNEVVITIDLANGWELNAEKTETVKIQGYSSVPPASNPAPGSFTTYKGESLTITVPAFDYYGIHLDVRKEISCD